MFSIKVTSSYNVEIIGMNAAFRETVSIYRAAIAFLINVVEQEWGRLAPVYIDPKTQLYALRIVETLILKRKDSAPKYPFEDSFYKMPCYLRRAAINAALGCVASYHSSLANCELSHKGKAPKLQAEHHVMPVFYRDNMYKEAGDPHMAWLKLRRRNDWVWIKVRQRPTDVRYLQKHWSHIKASAPILEKRRGIYYLRFSFTENVKLSETPVMEQRICAIDLGVNTDAVCSIMDANGTVLARKFINFASDKDHLYHVLNRIKGEQQKHGYNSTGAMWAYARRCNDEHAKKIAHAIVEYATLHNADTIVYEYLDFRGKKVKGSKKQKLHMWRKNGIQNYVEHNAHRNGIRISHVCAWKTSDLAYDGSGRAERNEHNRALATFETGKQYNSDLSASYNIGARYFIREILKSLPAMERSRLTAEVPAVERRTSCTASTLWSMRKAMAKTACACYPLCG